MIARCSRKHSFDGIISRVPERMSQQILYLIEY